MSNQNPTGGAHDDTLDLVRRVVNLYLGNIAVKADSDSVYLHMLPDFHANGWGGVWNPFGVGATHVTLPAPLPT